jgi:hypothetical protein
MNGRDDSQERLKKARELWMRFLYELGTWTGETEHTVELMDKRLGLTEADHLRWAEQVEAEERKLEGRDDRVGASDA